MIEYTTHVARGALDVRVTYEVDEGEAYAIKLHVRGVDVTDLFDEMPGWAHDAADLHYDEVLEYEREDAA